MNQTLRKALSLSLLVAFFTGSSMANPVKKQPEEQISKLLIIVLDGLKENRNTLELELAYDFGDYGIDVVLSHETTLVSAKSINKQMVIDQCKHHGTDGVLLVRLVDVEKENEYSYNQRTQYTGGGVYFWGDYSYAYGNYFDAVKSSRVVIETDIYAFPSEKLVYEKESRMRVKDPEEGIGKLAAKISKTVSKQKFMVKKK